MSTKQKALEKKKGSGNIPSTTHATRPVTAGDKKLSAKHLKESISYNLHHAEEHEVQAKKSEALLKKLK